jgi:hypothetical protein
MLLRVALALLIPVCIVAQDAAGEKPRAWHEVSESYQLSIASDKALSMRPASQSRSPPLSRM